MPEPTSKARGARANDAGPPLAGSAEAEADAVAVAVALVAYVPECSFAPVLWASHATGGQLTPTGIIGMKQGGASDTN